MSSVIKVDQIQLVDGSTPTAADLGLNITGSVLQVVQTVSNSSSSASANTWLEGNLTGTITPRYATSKILVKFDLPNIYDGSGTDFWAYITRNGTNLFSSYTTGNATKAGVNGYTLLFYSDGRQHASITYLDSPATTSACEYKWYLLVNGGTVYDNYPNDRGVQTLTMMEIAG